MNNAGLRFGQGTTITNRTLLVTLSPTGSVGSTAITIQAADIQDTNTASFVLNVVPPEFGRSSNTIGADTSFQPIWGDFNGDGLLDLVVSTTSIQTNRGNGLFSQGIQLPATQASSAAAADYEIAGGRPLLLRIPVRRKDEIILVPVSEIISVVADGELLHMQTTEKETYTICYRLKDLAARLEPERFVRLGRGTLVNVEMIRRIVPMPGGTFTVMLSNNQEYKVSRIQSRVLREQLLRVGRANRRRTDRPGRRSHGFS